MFLFANSFLAESLFNLISVNTPTNVPSGNEMHSAPATIKQKIRALCFLRLWPVRRSKIPKTIMPMTKADSMMTSPQLVKDSEGDAVPCDLTKPLIPTMTYLEMKNVARKK